MTDTPASWPLGPETVPESAPTAWWQPTHEVTPAAVCAGAVVVAATWQGLHASAREYVFSGALGGPLCVWLLG